MNSKVSVNIQFNIGFGLGFDFSKWKLTEKKSMMKK